MIQDRRRKRNGWAWGKDEKGKELMGKRGRRKRGGRS
jgi:hypothetical protein